METMSELGKHHARADVLGSTDDKDNTRLLLGRLRSHSVAVPVDSQLVAVETDLIRVDGVIESLGAFSRPHRDLDGSRLVANIGRVDMNGSELASLMLLELVNELTHRNACREPLHEQAAVVTCWDRGRFGSDSALIGSAGIHWLVDTLSQVGMMDSRRICCSLVEGGDSARWVFDDTALV